MMPDELLICFQRQMRMSERSDTIGLIGSFSAVLWSAKLDGNKKYTAYTTLQDPELLSGLYGREMATVTNSHFPRAKVTTLDLVSLNFFPR